MGSEETGDQHEEMIPVLIPNASDGSVSQSGMEENKTSNSPLGTGLKPDFSLLNGEIDLDNLSVKNLQEAFKATFGRETSVKNKQWLKRRIIMGLTNSCDFSTIECKKSSEAHEELLEGESKDAAAKTVPLVKSPANYKTSAEFCARPVQDFGIDGRCLTRIDSLGGSGIQVPYVSRIRRSRPRENYMTLMPSGFGISSRLEKNDVQSNEQLDAENGNKVLKNSASPTCIQEPACASSERKKTIQLEREVKPKNMKSCKTSSDDEVVTIPTANGGMRRKHHRPWTLSEVVKLVEGVAKYDAGKWSEIKRLAFASYSYRTSVDLKDKWRNLLRASLAESPTGDGGKFYRTAIRPALLYGTECWAVKQCHVQKMNVAEMRMLRWMCGHTKKDRLRNEVIREKVRVASIEDKMMENRLRWFGHVRRRPVDAPVRRLESWGTSNIVKGRDRPKKTWIKLIENDMRFLGIRESMAMERQIWRERIRVVDEI
ncbi:hypothetical protein OROMI_021085 [Orobanche minor]